MTDGLYPTLRTPLCDLLGCEVPILLAGMGGVSRWELAADVASAGGYPTPGMVREAPELIEREVQALRAATDRPFALNLIPAATDPELLDAQIACCLDLDVRAFSFFWDVMPSAVERVKAAGCLVLHQVGTVQAARDAEASGVDVLVAQGIEAGGHFHGRIGAFGLTAEILSGTRLPVVVSGGIADGRGLAAALAMGAAGVHCGKAFLVTTESFAHDMHKRRLVAAHAADTVLTDVFVLNWPRGTAVRVLANSVTEVLGDRLLGHDPDTLPREPIAWDDDLPPALRHGFAPAHDDGGSGGDGVLCRSGRGPDCGRRSRRRSLAPDGGRGGSPAGPLPLRRLRAQGGTSWRGMTGLRAATLQAMA